MFTNSAKLDNQNVDVASELHRIEDVEVIDVVNTVCFENALEEEVPSTGLYYVQFNESIMNGGVESRIDR